jgi:hypothetical protein
MKRVTEKIELGTNRKTCYDGFRRKNPFEIIKKEFCREEVLEIMKKKMPAENSKCGRKKLLRINPNQNQLRLMILMKI